MVIEESFRVKLLHATFEKGAAPLTSVVWMFLNKKPFASTLDSIYPLRLITLKLLKFAETTKNISLTNLKFTTSLILLP